MEGKKSKRETAARKERSVRQELNYLLDKGIKVTIAERYRERKHWWSRAQEVTGTRVIELEQPTLGALDAINYYLRDVTVDEQAIAGSVNPYPELRRIGRKHLEAVASAVAVAALGREAFVKVRGRYRFNERGMRRMRDYLLMNVTPGKLLEMVQAVCVMCNLSDFTNSIRLMQVAPDRIEPSEED